MEVDLVGVDARGREVEVPLVAGRRVGEEVVVREEGVAGREEEDEEEGIANLIPVWMRFGFLIPLASTRVWTVVPYLLASADSVSPCLTV